MGGVAGDRETLEKRSFPPHFPGLCQAQMAVCSAVASGLGRPLINQHLSPGRVSKGHGD